MYVYMYVYGINQSHQTLLVYNHPIPCQKKPNAIQAQVIQMANSVLKKKKEAANTLDITENNDKKKTK